nr:oligopeptide/dipeptide ABC transporter ATP-binding protein [Bacillus sp. T3]
MPWPYRANLELLIADEPTTALDVTLQTQIMDLLNSLKKEYHMSILLVTHDLGVAAQLADKIVVMYAGEIVEEATVHQLFEKPYHPYTKGLLQSIPKANHSRLSKLNSIEGSIPSLTEMPEGCRFHPRCSYATEKCKSENPPLSYIDRRHSACWHAKYLVKEKDWFNPPTLNQSSSVINQVEKTNEKPSNHIEKDDLFLIQELSKYYPLGHGGKQIKAVDNISFSIKAGESFGLVGESGSGKSTLGRAILKLEKITSGDVLFKGQSLQNLTGPEMRKIRKNMQIIFQDPYGSINPRWTIGKIIAEPLKVHQNGLKQNEVEAVVKELLIKVGLKPDSIERYPHEFSGDNVKELELPEQSL